MKTKWMFLLTLIMCQVVAAEKVDQNGQTVFLSYPYTGTNWTMCSLQYLTRRKFVGMHQYKGKCKQGYKIWNRLGVSFDQSKPPIYRTHNPSETHKLDPGPNKLLMIMRNYREVFFRKFQDISKPMGVFEKYLRRFVDVYISYFRTYEDWNQEKRFLFTYEDLVGHPEIVLDNILAFLNEPKIHLSEYVDNIDYYREKCLSSYHNQHKNGQGGGSMTKGKDMHFYSKKAEPWLLKALDTTLKKAAGEEMWEKYFSRYCVPIPQDS